MRNNRNRNFNNLQYHCCGVMLWHWSAHSWEAAVISDSTMTDYEIKGTQKPVELAVSAISEYRLSSRRWPMLILFVFCSMVNAMQWIQYSIISDVIVKFYDVSNLAVDLTSIVFMVTYIPLIFPASWILDKMVSSPKFEKAWCFLIKSRTNEIFKYFRVLNDLTMVSIQKSRFAFFFKNVYKTEFGELLQLL